MSMDDGAAPGAPPGQSEGVYSPGRARAVVICDAVFMALATAAVVARIASRRVKNVSLVVEDLILAAGLMFFYGDLICDILYVPLGRLGHHLINVQQAQLEAGAKVDVAAQCLYVMAMGLTRTLVCTTILRLTLPNLYRLWIATILVINTLWMVYGILSSTLRCQPFSQHWLPSVSSKCVSSQLILAISFGWGLLISCILWTLAVLAARHVHMPSLTRLGLAFVFVIAFFDIVIGVVAAATALTADRVDYSYTNAPPVVWQSLEPTLALVVVSLMACRPLWEHVFHIPPEAHPSSITGSSECRSGRTGGPSKDTYGRLKGDERFELKPGSSTTAAGGREDTSKGFVKGGLLDNRARRNQMLSGASAGNHGSMTGRDRGDLESGVFVRQEITVSAENRLHDVL